ncbi:MAG: Ig-like domain-containing protein [Actinobacteria bacterium]|nr:Ig-like domain-containing protein [Actinomycetota bacterium]
MKARPYRLVLVLAVVLWGLNAASAALALSPNVVISQVYGGGGATSSTPTFKDDYIELFNRGTAAVTMTDWSVQYGSGAAGNLNWSAKTTFSGTIQPGRYFLIKQAGGALGGTLPPHDASGTIAMGATAGKVALVEGSATLPTGCPAVAAVVDLVGYGTTAACFEGAGRAPAPSTTTADSRGEQGCTETDNNSSDFAAGAPTPRNGATDPHFCTGENGPFVFSTTPGDDAADVALDANVTIEFSEPVNVTAEWYEIECTTSGAHSATGSGGATTFVLDPDADFTPDETCTVTVRGANVSDQDALDPPDVMGSDYTFTFSTVAPSYRIFEIQGASHTSPYAGRRVSAVPGVITAVRTNSFYMQDATGDGNLATSDAILVFRTAGLPVSVGDAVLVSGLITEFRPGGAASANLTTTEIDFPTVVAGGPGAKITATVVGQGGRMPPTTVIEDDAAGDVETSGVFDPVTDGIDFYESMEAMLLQVNDAVVTGPRNFFGEVWVLADDGADAFLRTTREGIVVRATDFNPERIQLDDDIVPGSTPAVNVDDGFTEPAIGVLAYNFGNFEALLTSALTRVDGGLVREVTAEAKKHDLTVATFNVENLDPADGSAKFGELAEVIVENLRAPMIVALEEVQDDNGPTNDAVTDATLTYETLIAAIQAAGGPTYDFRQVDPIDDQDGGEPGGNIRVGFLFRTDVDDLDFVDRPGGTPTTANAVVETKHGGQLLYSPGRIDPTNPAFNNSRKPLAGEFLYRNRRVILIANHFNSKGGDQPLFGRFQPPARSSEVQRHQQAGIVNDFVEQILAADSKANVVVLGDLNDFEFSTTLDLLEGDVLTTLIETLPPSERYTYVFQGNSQALDHILVSQELAKHGPGYDVVHVNAEFTQQVSDHDPQVARLDVHGRAVPNDER